MTFFGKVTGIKNPVHFYNLRFRAACKVTALVVNAIIVNSMLIGVNTA